MNAKLRNPLLAAVAVALLPLVFVALQGLLARYHLASILTLRHVLSTSAATASVIYGYGIVGSALTAALIMVPLGLWLTWRPWLIGTAVSMLAVLLLMTTLQIPAPNNYVEYLSLIAFSALAAEFASRTKRTRRPP